jgi:hypothetical protein
MDTCFLQLGSSICRGEYYYLSRGARNILCAHIRYARAQRRTRQGVSTPQSTCLCYLGVSLRCVLYVAGVHAAGLLLQKGFLCCSYCSCSCDEYSLVTLLVHGTCHSQHVSVARFCSFHEHQPSEKCKLAHNICSRSKRFHVSCSNARVDRKSLREKKFINSVLEQVTRGCPHATVRAGARAEFCECS